MRDRPDDRCGAECPAVLGIGPAPRCNRPAGHDGEHQAASGALRWKTAYERPPVDADQAVELGLAGSGRHDTKRISDEGIGWWQCVHCGEAWSTPTPAHWDGSCWAIQIRKRVATESGLLPDGREFLVERIEAYLGRVAPIAISRREIAEELVRLGVGTPLPAEPSKERAVSGAVLHNGLPAYFICDLCGQPLAEGTMCNSSLHVGPGEGANGRAVASTEFVRAAHSAAAAQAEGVRAAQAEAVSAVSDLNEATRTIERLRAELEGTSR